MSPPNAGGAILGGYGNFKRWSLIRGRSLAEGAFENYTWSQVPSFPFFVPPVYHEETPPLPASAAMILCLSTWG
jgi:hypothetical protein